MFLTWVECVPSAEIVTPGNTEFFAFDSRESRSTAFRSHRVLAFITLSGHGLPVAPDIKLRRSLSALNE